MCVCAPVQWKKMNLLLQNWNGGKNWYSIVIFCVAILYWYADAKFPSIIIYDWSFWYLNNKISIFLSPLDDSSMFSFFFCFSFLGFSQNRAAHYWIDQWHDSSLFSDKVSTGDSVPEELFLWGKNVMNWKIQHIIMIHVSQYDIAILNVLRRLQFIQKPSSCTVIVTSSDLTRKQTRAI